MERPVDLYLGFDPAFFGTDRPETRIGGRARTDEAAADYRRLLKAEEESLNNALTSQLRPEDLGMPFYKELRSLAEREATPGEIIRKNIEGEFSVRAFCEKEGIPVPRVEEYVHGRTLAHLYRLYDTSAYHKELTCGWPFPEPSKAFCRRFARDYVAHVAAVEPGTAAIMDTVALDDIIGFTTTQTFWFWTLAPYLHLAFQEAGMEPSESMGRVLDWARDAVRRSGGNQQWVKLMHMEQLRAFAIDHGRPLGYDERMPTHLTSRLVSKAIAREILAEQRL